MKRISVAQIIITIDSTLIVRTREALEKIGVTHYYTLTGRQNTLRETSRFFGLIQRTALVGNRSEIVRFYVPQIYEQRVMNFLSEYLELRIPGRGTIFAESAELLSNIPFFNETVLKTLPAENLRKSFDYHLVTAVLPRGIADDVSTTVLEMGICVPTVYYGEGIGLRHKLGLIRITIPADKEIITFLVPTADSALLSGVVIQKARLDQPGQGILFVSNVRAQTVNMRIYHDRHHHMASMDQIISIIDELHGSTEWRHRSSTHKKNHAKSESGAQFKNINLFCDEGMSADAVQAAMQNGAGGATLIQQDIHLAGIAEISLKYISRESAEFIVGSSKIDDIIEAVYSTGFFAFPYDGYIVITDVDELFVHRSVGKKRL